MTYNDEFDALLSMIGYTEMSDKEMTAAYKHGLSKAIHIELISKEANDLASARKLAVSYCIREDNNNYVNYVGKEINKTNSFSNNRYNNNNNNNRNFNRPNDNNLKKYNKDNVKFYTSY